MMSSDVTGASNGAGAPAIRALEAVWLLSILVFLTQYTYEVLSFNRLYESQQFLLPLLELGLSLWAVTELFLVRKGPETYALGWLTGALVAQFLIGAVRHPIGLLGASHPAVGEALARNLPFGLATVFVPVYLLLFLTISKLVINAFSLAERQRAEVLQTEIDRRVKVEASLRESEERSRQIAEQLADLYEHAPCGYHSLDDLGRVVRMNQTELDWLGLCREDIVAKVRFQDLLNAEDAKNFDASFSALKETGQISKAELRLRHPDGSEFWVLLNATAIYDADGNYKASRATVTDISELKRAEAELAQQTRAAITANQAKSTFLSTTSHELRTPLNAIIGTAYLLGLNPRDAAQKRDLDTIQIASRSLLALINDVLDLSKIEAGELAIEVQPFALRAILEELRAMFAPVAAGKGIGLEIGDCAAEIPPVLEGDDNRLRQMLINLVSNAIKFTTAGRVVLQITVLERDVGGDRLRLRFMVTDTGIGIAPENLARLFQPFNQADNTIGRRFGGTGLGLSIVKRLATLMGGAVGADSELGRGSKFWFEVPFRVSSVKLPTEGTESGRGAVATAGRGLEAVNILVVDDSAMNLHIVERILAREGAHVTACASGLGALMHLQSTERGYDVVLMDLQMPDMDGCEATIQIRQRLGLANLPVIALTAGATTAEMRLAEDAGMNGFLTKPVEPARLVSAIREHLARALG